MAPVHFFTLIVFGTLAGVYIARMVIKSRAASGDTAGQHESEYRQLATRYDALASQSAATQEAMQSELKELRAKVESMERMMSEVG